MTSENESRAVWCSPRLDVGDWAGSLPSPVSGAAYSLRMAHAWVNGRLVEPGEPSVAVADHGLVVGDGVFEATKVVDGKPFAVRRHLARMDRSLAGFGLPPADHGLIREGIAAVLEQDPGMPFGKLRWWVTAGVGPFGSDRGGPVGALSYHVAADRATPWGPTTTVHVVPWTRNERAATAGIKTTSYADNVLALAAAHQAGASEAIFGNTRGELCEGTGSNIGVVIDGQALTPPLSSGALAGITRELLLHWSAESDTPVREQSLPLEVLQRADEVFLTNSSRDVHPVVGVDSRALPVGPITEALRRLWGERAGESADP